MLFRKQIALKFPCLGARKSLLVLGVVFVAACSSAESSPTSNAAGGAGAATSAGTGPSAGAAGISGTAAGVAGSTGGSGTSGSGQGGSPAGGTSGSSGGSAAGVGGTGATTGGGTNAGGASGAGGTSNAPFALTSTAFKEGEQIPLKHKCANVNPKGENISPPLSWGPGPVGTKSYAVVLMHVPSPEHWVLWDIPANVTSLPENIEHVAQPAVPAGSKQSLANLDGFNGSGYLGPCPQAPNSTQSYTFTLYALDVETVPGLTATSTPTAAATAVKAHLVAGSQGVSLTGTQIQTP
jgi:Raf kinase inhibitor-like YbhB/YbcL family protein